jgi:hypothetical protein
VGQRKSLGVIRDTRPEPRPFSRFFTNQMRSTDEYIDFEKLPIKGRRLAPFVKPLGQGKGIYSDKPAGTASSRRTSVSRKRSIRCVR